MKYENDGLIITFPQITWIEHGFDENDDIDYAIIHFGNGEFIGLYESEVDEFLDAFRAWCDMNSHVITNVTGVLKFESKE